MSPAVSPFSEKSFRVLETLSQEDGLSQRHVAMKTGLSLGMVNLILRRLIKTGCIKVGALNSRKMGYILTPKGMAERMARSYTYLLRAYHTYHEAQQRIDGLLYSLLEGGERDFVILGEGEIPAIVEMSLLRLGRDGVKMKRALSAEGLERDAGGAILDCRLDRNPGSVGISILETILGGPQGEGRPSVDDRLLTKTASV